MLVKSIEAIFLDFDGVILESVEVKGWAFGKLFEDYPDYVDEIIAFHHANGGMSRFDKFRYIYKNILQQPLSDGEFERLSEEFSSLVYHRVLECDFVPGAMEFLQKYYHRVLLFVISGTPHDEISKIVDRKGLTRYFRAVFGSPTSKNVWTKKIVKEHRLNSKKVLFVGDAMSDYIAAKENGLFFVARVKNSEDDIFKGAKVGVKIPDLFGLDRLLHEELIG